jgi:transcriptional regulator with XRE-family HTH domain
MTIVDALARARKRQKVSLRQIAERSGIAKSNLSAIENGRRDPNATTVDRIADATGVRVIVFPIHGRATLHDAAAAIAASLARDDRRTAYRSLIQASDDLANAQGVDCVMLTVEEPETVTPEWDAALAGLAEWRLRQHRLPEPEWVTERKGNPDWQWSPHATRTGKALPVDVSLVPEEFSRRGVLIESGELESV